MTRLEYIKICGRIRNMEKKIEILDHDNIGDLFKIEVVEKEIERLEKLKAKYND